MAFMQPQYTNEPFLSGENYHGEGIAVPFSTHCNLNSDFLLFAAKNDVDVQEGTKERFVREHHVTPSSVEIVIGKWWCRLSAPGYMDCTDWDGPHDTEQEARDAIQRDYEVNPDTGDDLDDDDEESSHCKGCGSCEGCPARAGSVCIECENCEAE